MGRFWENEGDQEVEGGMSPLVQEVAVIHCSGVVRREQGDTVLECSIAADSNVHRLLWERGRKKVENQRGSILFLACCSSLSGHFPQEHISFFFLRL